jgi:Tol biopolymer transport system component/regulation of enolase protein 1 (concanavalin A-like superfamily)
MHGKPSSLAKFARFLPGLLLIGAMLAAAAGCGKAPQAPAPESPLTLFDAHGDIGGVARPGSVSVDAANGAIVIDGAGVNMWFAADEGHFLWKRLTGDFIVSARVEFPGAGVEAHRKIGWMARSSLDPGSAHASAVVHGDGLTSLQFRKKAEEDTDEVRLSVSGPDQVQLERRGDTYIMSAARFGEPYASERVNGLSLGDELLVGLFVCSHNAGVTERARFTNVRLTIPAPEGFIPYQDYIGGTIEILDVETGNRTVVYRSPRPIQAPNWTKDGRFLIYNVDGFLNRFELATGKTSRLETGFATANNNDHVLSFDGKKLGISHHSAGDGDESVIYVLPAKGGTPKRVTPKGPSYLHGWSPDGRFLVYTGGRAGNYDIYKISIQGGDEVRLTDAPGLDDGPEYAPDGGDEVRLTDAPGLDDGPEYAPDGGDEVRLTDAPGLDDGPEYAPDGRTIYFNSSRTGDMRIWRMTPDGSGQEPVTSGVFHDWFPHVSPDGRRIVFLSFQKDVAADDHPFYKQVYIRMMSAADGPDEPRVIAYVYGGQGTINVPSWSPDSKRIAFVSNSRLRSAP